MKTFLRCSEVDAAGQRIIVCTLLNVRVSRAYQTPVVQQGGDRRLLAEKVTQGKEPLGEKELSYGEAFLQSYKKCEPLSLMLASDIGHPQSLATSSAQTCS